MSAAPAGNAAEAPERFGVRRRLAFWVWMLGIASIVGGAALTHDSTAAGAIVGSLGVICCVVGWFLRVSTEQRSA